MVQTQEQEEEAELVVRSAWCVLSLLCCVLYLTPIYVFIFQSILVNHQEIHTSSSAILRSNLGS